MKELIKKIVIFGGAQLFTVIAAIIRNKVAAYTIGAAGLGLSALYQTISQLITNITNIGLPDSAVQSLSSIEDNDKRHSQVAILRLWELITSLAAFVLLAVISPLICIIYFGSWHTSLGEILLLSLVPPCFIVNGIELAILKSYGATRRLTSTIILTSILSIAISVPLYIYIGWKAIVFVVLLSAIATAIVALYHGTKVCNAMPNTSILHAPKTLWQQSRPMVLLGLSLVITGVCSMGAELITQTYFSTIASLAMVGFYKAGYQFSVTYPCMIFTAVSNDYYPRLASLAVKTTERNRLVRQQIKALLMVTTPCIAMLIVLAPYIITLLLSDEYQVITPLVRIGCLSVIVRCFSLPICFIPLATGDSRNFIQMELFSYAVMMLCVIIGFHFMSLTGIGIGILASNVFDLIYGYILAKNKYGL